MADSTKSRRNEFATLLADMNKEGGFLLAVLADWQSLSIASATAPDQDPDTRSAVVALVQKTTAQVHDQLGMAQTDEISMYDVSGQRLVCRPFNASEHDMILAVLVPNERQSYRPLTNKAVNAIHRTLLKS
jgi:predicted regulator of Ras-like GTPase activity (Roadblock/LC7/MglB family)